MFCVVSLLLSKTYHNKQADSTLLFPESIAKGSLQKNASRTDTTTLTQHNTYTAHTHHATVYTNIHLSHTPRDSIHRHTPRNRITYAGHIHYAAAFASPLHDTTPTPSITYTAHLHRATAFAHIAFTLPSIFSFSF